jgi:hypothetical protein
VKSILEIGLGAGPTAWYFEQDKQIEFHASIDSTQGCYLLQSLVHDAAYSKDWCEAGERSARDPLYRSRALRVPWRKISQLYNNPMKFDVITANTCLNEMTDQALGSYLNIFDNGAYSWVALMPSKSTGGLTPPSTGPGTVRRTGHSSFLRARADNLP